MQSASKMREIAKRAQFNIYDSQLRLLFEEIYHAAKEGDMSYTIHSWNCSGLGFSPNFWFSSAKQNSDNWQKVNKVLSDLEYNVNYTIVNYNEEKITISW